MFPYWQLLKVFTILSVQSIQEEWGGGRDNLWGLFRTVLQHSVQDLHVVGVSGIGQLVEDHQFHHGGKVVSVCIEQLPGGSQPK